MKRLGLAGIGLMACMLVRSQVLHTSFSPPYAGSGIYSGHHTDVFSFTANQAALAQLKNSSAGVYTERQFLLPALNAYQFAMALITSSGNFGLKAGYSGFSDYNESQVGLAHARKLGKKTAIGVQFNYNSISIAGYGAAAAITAEAGAVVQLTEQLQAGIHINNPVGGTFGSAKQEKIATAYTVGFGYEPSSAFFISAAIVKEEGQPVNVILCAHYQFARQLAARAGVSTATSSVWAGAGVSWKTFRVDATVNVHPRLGISPGLLFLFSFKSKEKDEEE